jgi:Flp pilus assembly protein TadG
MSARYGPMGALRRQRGLAMVEFAISVPVILLLMFGSFEFGHLMTAYSTLNDGVRNAARFVAGAALQNTADTMATGANWTNLQTQGTNLAIYGNIAGTGSPILEKLDDAQTTTITVSEDTVARTITVAVDYPYVPLFGSAIPTFMGMGGSLSTAYHLTISTTMRAL